MLLVQIGTRAKCDEAARNKGKTVVISSTLHNSQGLKTEGVQEKTNPSLSPGPRGRPAGHTSFNSSFVGIALGFLEFRLLIITLPNIPKEHPERGWPAQSPKRSRALASLARQAWGSSRRTGRRATCLRGTFLVHEWELAFSKYSSITRVSGSKNFLLLGHWHFALPFH